MASERWEIDSSHSSLHFSVRHLVIAKVRGSFARWSGTIQVPDGDFSKATVAVTIDASSIDTSVADRDAHLKSPDFFDAERYPELRFTAEQIDLDGDTITAPGELTMKGVTKPDTVSGTILHPTTDYAGNERIGLRVSTKVDRTEFGINWNAPLPTGKQALADEVTINGDLYFVKAA